VLHGKKESHQKVDKADWLCKLARYNARRVIVTFIAITDISQGDKRP